MEELYESPAVITVEMFVGKVLAASADEDRDGTLEEMNRDNWGGSWDY